MIFTIYNSDPWRMVALVPQEETVPGVCVWTVFGAAKNAVTAGHSAVDNVYHIALNQPEITQDMAVKEAAGVLKVEHSEIVLVWPELKLTSAHEVKEKVLDSETASSLDVSRVRYFLLQDPQAYRRLQQDPASLEIIVWADEVACACYIYPGQDAQAAKIIDALRLEGRIADFSNFLQERMEAAVHRMIAFPSKR
jgi:hypothetical protein